MKFTRHPVSIRGRAASRRALIGHLAASDLPEYGWSGDLLAAAATAMMFAEDGRIEENGAAVEWCHACGSDDVFVRIRTQGL